MPEKHPFWSFPVFMDYFREREFERWTSEAFYDRGKRHGYYRQYRWDHKFLRLGCFIRGQPLKNLYAAKVEGAAWILKVPKVCFEEKAKKQFFIYLRVRPGREHTF